MIVFYSVILNHHQAPVADELWTLCKGEYRFVELMRPNEEINKGGRKYDDRPYLIQAWKGEAEKAEAMRFALTADVCVFGGDLALPYQKARLKKNLLSFEVGERWLKRGWKNLFSPRLLKMIGAYYLYGWRKKPLYKLCASAYGANDQYKLGTFKDKCYKWGYFTEVKDLDIMRVKTLRDSDNVVRIMWCGRFIDWKHPEMVVLLAKALINENIHFDMYGDGPMLNAMKELSVNDAVEDKVTFHGSCSNDIITNEMQKHHLFLVTSDRNEGWGAVLNESMSNACAVVASNAMGAAPFLVKEGENGMLFQSGKLENLVSKVKYLMNNPDKRQIMQENAYLTIHNVWSPANAAHSFILLSEALKENKETLIKDGPGSIAHLIL